jgi:transcriptional regulator with XRE-family HTH domain
MATAITDTENIKARPDQIRALDALRRARRVTLDQLSQRCGWSKTQLSRALSGYVRMSRADVRRFREIIEEVAR